jgi:N-acetylneuraminic acid mutarotase
MKSESIFQTQKMRKIKSRKFPKRIYLYSSPRMAQRMAYKYLGKTAKLYPASNPAKKYMIYDPKNNKWVNFGQLGFQDFTKHRDKTRRKNYLTRTKGMLGDWKNNKYSANNLSRHILWP